MLDLFSAHPRLHTVKYDENLAVISTRYYGDPGCVHAIFQANRDRIADPNRVYAGQVLVIPHLPHYRSRNRAAPSYV